MYWLYKKKLKKNIIALEHSERDEHRKRVLETRFIDGRHVEKVPTQIRLEHENRPSKTQFIVQNQAS